MSRNGNAVSGLVRSGQRHEIDDVDNNQRVTKTSCAGRSSFSLESQLACVSWDNVNDNAQTGMHGSLL